MHAHDRTLLARLGFADPDKRDPVHELACRHLCLPETITSLRSLLGLSDNCEPYRTSGHSEEFAGVHWTVWEGFQVRREHPLSKGEGRYQTTIGFLDVLVELRGRFETRERCVRRKIGWRHDAP